MFFNALFLEEFYAYVQSMHKYKNITTHSGAGKKIGLVGGYGNVISWYFKLSCKVRLLSFLTMENKTS